MSEGNAKSKLFAPLQEAMQLILQARLDYRRSLACPLHSQDEVTRVRPTLLSSASGVAKLLRQSLPPRAAGWLKIEVTLGISLSLTN